MLSSINQYVRMLDGRDRGTVVEMNREIALDLIEREQAIAIDVTAKNALAPWNEAQLAKFRQERDTAAEHGVSVPIAEVTEVKVRTEVGEVSLPRTAVEVSLPRATAKTKKR